MGRAFELEWAGDIEVEDYSFETKDSKPKAATPHRALWALWTTGRPYWATYWEDGGHSSPSPWMPTGVSTKEEGDCGWFTIHWLVFVNIEPIGYDCSLYVWRQVQVYPNLI